MGEISFSLVAQRRLRRRLDKDAFRFSGTCAFGGIQTLMLLNKVNLVQRSIKPEDIALLLPANVEEDDDGKKRAQRERRRERSRLLEWSNTGQLERPGVQWPSPNK